jgi:hypothetical protein
MRIAKDIDGECRKARSIDNIFTLILTFKINKYGKQQIQC